MTTRATSAEVGALWMAAETGDAVALLALADDCEARGEESMATVLRYSVRTRKLPSKDEKVGWLWRSSVLGTDLICRVIDATSERFKVPKPWSFRFAYERLARTFELFPEAFEESKDDA